MTADAVNPSSSLPDKAFATTITFEDDALEVPAAVIAYGFDLETPMVQSLMRSGELTSLCEKGCLLYTSPSPRDGLLSRMPSSA